MTEGIERGDRSMRLEEIRTQIDALIKEYDKQMAELNARYEAKWYLAETAKEHLAINEWHDAETAKLNTWYGRKLSYFLEQM